jgi:integrase
MRSKGSGSILLQANGKRRVLAPPDESGYRAPLGTADTLAEAQAILDGALVRLAEGQTRVQTGATVSEYGKRYLDARDEQGLTNERSRWGQHIEPDPIAGIPIRSLEPLDVRAWIERVGRKRAAPGNGHTARVTRPVAPQTLRNVLHLLSACLQAAAADGLRPDNPARGVSIPKRKSDLLRATVDPWTWLDPDEQACAIECAPEPCGWLVQFAIWTGLRESELWELRRADVRDDLLRPEIVVRYGSEGGPTKGRRIRRVPMLPGACEAWERWQQAAKERIAATGIAFPPLRGSRRATRAPGPPSWWDETVERAGVRGQLGAPVTWHTLRHTCGAMLASGYWGRAWRLEEIREWMGHREAKTTERYATLSQRAIDRAADETRLALAREPAEVVELSDRDAIEARKR